MQRILSGQQGRTLPGHGGATAFRRLPTERPLIDGRFDWTMVFLSAWFVAGVFLDGWAHNHVPELESFFTPWHAVFYSGYAAVSGFLLTALLRHRRQGFGWRQALPVGYELSLWGVGIFLIGGIGDMVWHELFGIEAGSLRGGQVRPAIDKWHLFCKDNRQHCARRGLSS